MHSFVVGRVVAVCGTVVVLPYTIFKQERSFLVGLIFVSCSSFATDLSMLCSAVEGDHFVAYNVLFVLGTHEVLNCIFNSAMEFDGQQECHPMIPSRRVLVKLSKNNRRSEVGIRERDTESDRAVA